MSYSRPKEYSMSLYCGYSVNYFNFYMLYYIHCTSVLNFFVWKKNLKTSFEFLFHRITTEDQLIFKFIAILNILFIECVIKGTKWNAYSKSFWLYINLSFLFPQWLNNHMQCRSSFHFFSYYCNESLCRIIRQCLNNLHTPN